MKKLIRKFAVLNRDRSSDKVVLPMNMAALEHILNVRDLENTIPTENAMLGYSNLRWVDNDKAKALRRMANVPNYGTIFTGMNEDGYFHDTYLKMIDGEVKINDRFFDFLIGGTSLKYLEQDGKRLVLVDDSLIPQGMIESFIKRRKLVQADDESEIYGDENIMSYHFNNYHPEISKQFTKFMDLSAGAVNFGFEAEKVDADMVDVGSAMKLTHETGFKKEYDGSLGSDGFELISPILPLFNQQVIADAISPVLWHLNADTNDSCGGHINLSKNGMQSRDILKKVKGNLPLIYSLYAKRLDNRFCPARMFSNYLRRPTKYSACYLKNRDILELRIFPAIKNLKILQNRIELLRMVMGENFGKSSIRMIVELANPTSNIHNFMLNTILNGNREKLVEKIRSFAFLSEKYGCGKISLPAKKKVNKLMQCDVFNIPAPTPTISVDDSISAEVENESREVTYITHDGTTIRNTSDNATSEQNDSLPMVSYHEINENGHGHTHFVRMPNQGTTQNIVSSYSQALSQQVKAMMIGAGFFVDEYTQDVVGQIDNIFDRIIQSIRTDIAPNGFRNRNGLFLAMLSSVIGTGIYDNDADTYLSIQPTMSQMNDSFDRMSADCRASETHYTTSVLKKYITTTIAAIFISRLLDGMNDRMYGGYILGRTTYIRFIKKDGKYTMFISKSGEGIHYRFSWDGFRFTMLHGDFEYYGNRED